MRSGPGQALRGVVAAALLVTAVAHADGRFDAAYQAGQDLFHLGRYAEAREAFARARTLEPRLPGPHRWLGRTARVLERWEDCIASATDAIRLRPDSPLAAQVKDDLDACRAALGRPAYPTKLLAGQGALAVLADEDGVEVTVDGIRRGPTPVPPFPLNAGEHKVEAADREAKIVVVPGIVVDAVLRVRHPETRK